MLIMVMEVCTGLMEMGYLKWETFVCQKMCTGQSTSDWTRDPQG